MQRNNKRAQALTELAIFGTVVLAVFGYLLSYGLSDNYSEHLQMSTFRQALNKAYDASNTYLSSTVIAVKDKPLPATDSGFFLPKRSPITASASARWSNSLMMSWQPKQDYGNPDMLPKVTLLIGGKEYNLSVAGWVTYSCTSDARCGPSQMGTQIREKKDDPQDLYRIDGRQCGWGGLKDGVCDGIYWYWRDVVFIQNVESNNYYDVDGDEKLEMVIGKEPDKDIQGNRLLRCLDYQEGEIDTSLSTKDKREGVYPYSGLTGEYESHENKGIAAIPIGGVVIPARPTSLAKTEDKERITTVERIRIQDNFYHLVRLNRVTDKIRNDAEKYGDRLDGNLLWINDSVETRTTQRWSTPK